MINKLSAALFFAIVLMATLLYAQVKTNGQQRAEITLLEQKEIQANELIDKERNMAAKASQRDEQRIQHEEQLNAELEKLRTCIADKSCGVRLHYQACQALSSTATSQPGAVKTDAGHQERLEQDYLSLIASIDEVTVNYAALQREIVARSDPNYCQQK